MANAIRTKKVMIYRILFLLSFMCFMVFVGPIQESNALPGFARKYEVNCQVCHTRQPRLNSYGEQFLENGFQLPGTEDGGLIGKAKLGDLTLDQVSNYFSVLFATDVVQHVDLDQEIEGVGDQTEFATPAIFRLFTAGTVTSNVGYYADVTSIVGRSNDVELGRAYLTLNNLGGQNWAHLRIGRLDPSAFFSFPTGRPQITPTGPNFGPPFGPFGPTQTLWALTPSAFASKFYGIFDREGDVIHPFEQTLFNSDEEVAIDVHGRPFGDWFLYQVGVLNGGNERAGDSNNSKDWFVMARLDYAQSHLFSASLSGFAYVGNHNAKVLTGEDISRHRYGVASRLRYRWLDVYGAFTLDKVRDLPKGMDKTFDDTATGLTVEAQALATDRLLLGVRYNHLDAGGVLANRKSATFLTLQMKYYLRSNIAFTIRDDINLRAKEGGTHATRNLRNVFNVGISIVF